MKRTIEFPDMRMNVLCNLDSLSDKDHQIKTWVRHEEYDSFDEVIHCLFDDSCFENNPRRTLNTLLFEEMEADKIRIVMNLINKLFEKYGKDLRDAEYIAKPEWPAIMASALAALDTMKRNDLRYMDPAERAQLYRKFGFKE